MSSKPTKPTETNGMVDATGTLSRPEAGSVLTRSADADWVADGDSGFFYKTLYEDKDAGLSTMLMKVEPGNVAPSHAHDNLEQVLVLEGDFYDEYRTYGPGYFVVRAPGAIHTGGTETGAVLLLVYSD